MFGNELDGEATAAIQDMLDQHVADSQDKPLVAVFGPTSRELGFYPQGSAARVVWSMMASLDGVMLYAALGEKETYHTLYRTTVDLLVPSWRWVFYVTVPLSLLAAIYVWAASPDWDVEPGSSRMDAVGWRGKSFTAVRYCPPQVAEGSNHATREKSPHWYRSSDRRCGDLDSAQG